MLIVLDCETTGLDPANDQVIEIAACDVMPDYTIANQRSHLVRPTVPIGFAASAVHHILLEDLEGAPALEDVLGEYAGACGIIAHNCAFEQSMLAEKLGPSKKTGQPPIWICTYKCALRLFPTALSHGNQALRYQLDLINPLGVDRHTLVAHRALSDVIVTAALFVEMAKLARWSQLALWSSEPALHTVFGFGKHRGKRYDEVAASDGDYLRWIIDKSDLDAGTKFSAAHWLQQEKAA